MYMCTYRMTLLKSPSMLTYQLFNKLSKAKICKDIFSRLILKDQSFGLALFIYLFSLKGFIYKHSI